MEKLNIVYLNDRETVKRQKNVGHAMKQTDVKRFLATLILSKKLDFECTLTIIVN
jgi:hypothetical protein